jgi:hypothetical protein
MPEAAHKENVEAIRVKKPDPRDDALSLGDYLTTEPRTRDTTAQQLKEARRRFLRDNR